MKIVPRSVSECEESTVETTGIDSTQVEVKSTIDGNVELDSTASTIPAVQSKIKINITKNLSSSPREPKDQSAKEEAEGAEDKPLEPVEEEEEVPLQPASVKATLAERSLSVLPRIDRGEELSALCSIM